MSNTVKLGIIGCGGIARSHRAAAAFNHLPIVSVSDISEEAARGFLEGNPEAKAYTSPIEQLDQGDINAVIICTPPRHHANVAIAALERGIHVLCEKPLAANLEESQAIEAAADRSKALFMMAFRHRFTAAQQAIKAFFDTGEAGRIVLFQNIFGGPARQMKDLWFSKFALAGGGSLIDTSIHSLDLFRHYCGEVATFSGERDRAFEGTDVEDSAVLSLRAENGALGIIASSWNYATGIADLRIVGEHATVTYDYRNPTVFHISRTGQTEVESVTVEATGGFNEQLAHFADSIRLGKAPSPGVSDGRRAAEIIEAVYLQRPLAL